MVHGTNVSRATKNWRASFKSRNALQQKGFATAVPYIPGEILLEIAEHIVSPRDIVHFCLMVRTSSLVHLDETQNSRSQSKSAYRLLLPALYISLDLISFEICKDRLEFLIKHPELARRIRKLVLRPSCWLVSSAEALDNEVWVTKVLELLAPNLHALYTFIWDGLEMPEDRIWSTLRNSCVYISTFLEM